MTTIEVHVEIDGEEITVRVEGRRVDAEHTDPREAAAKLLTRACEGAHAVLANTLPAAQRASSHVGGPGENW